MNLLPRNGTVIHYGRIFDEATARCCYDRLISPVPWRHDEVVMFGKIPYRYSGSVKQAAPWTTELAELKKRIEKITGLTFNSCLANLYHHGGEGMRWHSDDEKSLAKHAGIASLSLGAERIFSFRHKRDGDTVSITLENGSLLVMKDETQDFWKHALPKSAKVKEARINLTFRTMIS